jgi:hypothetical protein
MSDEWSFFQRFFEDDCCSQKQSERVLLLECESETFKTRTRRCIGVSKRSSGLVLVCERARRLRSKIPGIHQRRFDVKREPSAERRRFPTGREVELDFELGLHDV